jgi:hypothetical protein
LAPTEHEEGLTDGTPNPRRVHPDALTILKNRSKQ